MTVSVTETLVSVVWFGKQDVGGDGLYRVVHDDPLRCRVKKERQTGTGDGLFYLLRRRTW